MQLQIMSSLTEVGNNQMKLAQFSKLLDQDDSYEKIKKIVDSGIEINCTDLTYYRPYSSGFTALHFAVDCRKKQQSESVVKLLLSHNPDVTKRSYNGDTPLCLAYLINSDESNITLRQNTILNLLLAHHLQFNIATNPCNKVNISHFHIACITNNIDVVKYFLESGVSVHETITHHSNKWPGCTPLHLVMHNEDPDIVRLLLNHGAVESLDAEGKSPLHLLLEKQIKDAACDDMIERNRKLSKNEEVLDLMTASNRYLDDNVGLTPFHVYCTRNQSFQPEVFKEFLKNGADVNASINSQSPVWPGYRPIHFAVLCNSKAAILLLENGANLLDTDASGTTALDLCLKRYNPVKISSILKAQNSLNTIKLTSGVKLTDVLCELETAEKLHSYLKNNQVNTVISSDSPVWAGYSLLHLAVYFSREDDVSILQTCSRHRANMMIQGKNEMTALHLAFYLRKVKCLEEIMYMCPDTPANLTDQNNLSHFHIACVTNNIKGVELYLLSGSDPNLPLKTDLENLENISGNLKDKVLKSGFRPLHIAVALQSEPLIKLLLKHNADPLLTNAEGFTWIHYAARITETSAEIKSLAKYFWMSPKTRESNPIAPGALSHFHVACCTGHLATVQALLPFVSNINEPINEELEEFSDMYGNVEIIPMVDWEDTALHLAVKSENVEVIDFLLRNGADRNAGNTYNSKALMECAVYYSKTVDRLVCEQEAQGKWIDEETGVTLLHVACYTGDVSLMKRYFAAKQDSHWQIITNYYSTYQCLTPLQILIHYKQDNEVALKLLIDYIMSFDRDEISSTQPLHDSIKRHKIASSKISNFFKKHEERILVFRLSCLYGFIDILEKLIKMGMDVNHQTDHFENNGGCTPLHIAVMYDKADVIELLLRSGANYKLEDSYGNTPLHLAALEKPHLLQIFLRSTKIDIEIRNSFDETPFELLFERENFNINHILNFLRQVDTEKKISLATKSSLVKKFLHKLSEDVFKSVIICISDLNDIDDSGRNVIHSIAASNYPDGVEFTKLSNKIELLKQIGCDIDCQDREGMTPLHYAVLKRNTTIVEALLSVGADINVVNSRGQAASDFSEVDDTNTVILQHINKIRASGLYLDPLNIRFFRDHEFDALIPPYLHDLNAMKKVVVTRQTNENPLMYTMRDILTNEMVMRFPLMSPKLRHAIINFVNSCYFYKKFSHWLPLFKLQCRKALKRDKLLKSAVDKLQHSYFMDPRLPQNCLEFIFINLSNEDLLNLIAAKG